VVTLLSYLAFALLVVCFGYAVLVKFRASFLQGKEYVNPFLDQLKDVNFHMSKEEALRHMDTVLDLYNLFIDRLTDIFFITSFPRSLKYMAIFYAALYVGEWFSGLTLAYLSFATAFIWPRLYEERKQQIDQVVGTVKSEAQKYYEIGVSKLPAQLRSAVAPSVDKKRD